MSGAGSAGVNHNAESGPAACVAADQLVQPLQHVLEALRVGRRVTPLGQSDHEITRSRALERVEQEPRQHLPSDVERIFDRYCRLRAVTRASRSPSLGVVAGNARQGEKRRPPQRQRLEHILGNVERGAGSCCRPTGDNRARPSRSPSASRRRRAIQSICGLPSRDTRGDASLTN
jgi:hypothetical protein